MTSVPIRCRSIEGLGHTVENPEWRPGNGLNGISLNREAAGTTLEQLEVLPGRACSRRTQTILRPRTLWRPPNRTGTLLLTFAFSKPRGVRGRHDPIGPDLLEFGIHPRDSISR